VRKASTDEVQLIFEELLKLLQKSPAAQMKLAVPEVALAHLRAAQAAGHLWIQGDFAILVDVGSPWYTDRPVLIEEIIIRYRRDFGNPPEDVALALPLLAEILGCAAIAAGDTQVGLMGPRYLAAGFTALGTQFFKEIPNGVRAQAHRS